MKRLLAALALVSGVLSGVPGTTQSTGASWQADVQRMLDRRARSVETGDLRTFADTMRGGHRSFVDARTNWFTRLQTLPLGTYSLKLYDNGFGDLAGPVDKRRYGPDTHVVQVKERIGFRGYDRTPAYEDLFLTVRKDAKGWSVVSDTDRESLFLLSMRNLWDFGAVQNLQRDGIMVIYHPAQASAASRILASAQQARSTARERWPYPWRDPIVVMVPSTVAELARILQTQFDLSSFVAFASASEDRTNGWALTGLRVFLHWPNFSRYSASFQQTILDHEFTHLASFDTESPYMPSFMDEGVAQFFGEAAGHGPRTEESASIHNGSFTSTMPPDWQFSAGTRSEIFRAYEEALSFQAYLADRFGHTVGAKIFVALAKQSPVAAGTSRYHLQRAFLDVLKVSFEDLQRGWAAGEIAALR